MKLIWHIFKKDLRRLALPLALWSAVIVMQFIAWQFARPGNDEIAIAKATTSAMTCRPTVVWEKWIEGPHKAYATFPFIAAQGGLPIIVDGDLIGAIGVSGVKSFQDEQIALAAIKAAFPDAKTVRAGEENDARDF